MNTEPKNTILLSGILIMALISFAKSGDKFQAYEVFLKQQPAKQLQLPGERPPGEYRVHNIGTLQTAVSNIGIQGSPEGALPSMEWPRGSGAHHLWQGELWCAGVVDNEVLCTSPTFLFDRVWYPSEGSSFQFGPGKSMQDHYVIYDDLNPIEGYVPLGVRVRERGLTWSLEDYDDFIALEYEVENAGQSTIYDFCIAWIYDCDICLLGDFSLTTIDDLVDYEGWDGIDSDTDVSDIVDPYDLDGDGETGYDEWGFPYALPLDKNGAATNPNYDANKAEPDGFYDEWQLLLDPKGPVVRWQTRTNPARAAAGTPAIIDGDTLRGYVISRNASYMFDHDNLQTPEGDIGERNSPQPTPGFMFCRLIYSDIINESRVFPYKNTDDDTIMRPYAHQWWHWSTWPITASEKYQYMLASHPSSVKMGVHYDFIPLPFEFQAPVFDYRFLMSSGPFLEFQPGQVLRFVVAVGVGKGFQGMRETMDNAMRAYYAGSLRSDPYHPSSIDPVLPDGDYHWLLSIPPPMPNLRCSPLDRGVRLSWDNFAESTIDVLEGGIDFEGYKIYRSVHTLENWQLIAAFDNQKKPVLVENSDGEIVNAKKDLVTGEVIACDAPGYDSIENFEYVKEDLPPLTNSYDDYGGSFLGREIEAPVNGLKYYYAVVAYDHPKPASGDLPEMKSQESPKSNYLVDPKSGQPMPVIPGLLYTSETAPAVDLSKIRVVPNPYKGTSLYEERYDSKIRFINLPPACKISIYTIAGDLVDSIYHSDGSDSESWELITRIGLRMVSGLYLYVVETRQPTHEKFIGKFAVIR
ncbi:hypothetical protein JXJ21_15915 [candidate division KSB1 bacterium]|nr:hypothetical protein [candidate division KSB1 bacterium]